MSDTIHHHCGIALIRLRKSLQYFEQKYGTPLYAFNKLFLLMEKQHNRGQDGAGIGGVKLNMPPGQAFMFRDRALEQNSLGNLFKRQLKGYDKLVRQGVIMPEYAPTVKEHFDFGGEVLMGHLRYGTSGRLGRAFCQPYFRRSNWPTRNLMILGNFNMTNTAELNRILIRRGQHPIFDTDTQTVLEEIGFHLDQEHDRIYHEMREEGIPGEEIPEVISQRLDIASILRTSASVWDGGYTLAGLIGNGDAFVIRDPHGIRPCYYFENEEIVGFASERVPLMTVFDLPTEEVHELPPGKVAIMKNTGGFVLKPFAEPAQRTSCSFERIYFSRGNDPEIYNERRALGGMLIEQILEVIENDLENSVFSYIPNTAETAYYGMMRAMRQHRRREVKQKLLEAHLKGELTEKMIDDLILRNWPRSEKVAHKDIKLRTFISQEKGRSKMVSHVYDITYDVVRPTDNLVVTDDSIVRGTTLRESILKILARTNPKRIVIASTAPQIRYPDCYGIDMSELGKFVAFQAAIKLLRERGQGDLIEEVYHDCLRELDKPTHEQENLVRRIYAPFQAEEISAQIAALLYPPDIEWKGEIHILFQKLENLHKAIPHHPGDWYFSGHYPTPGGTAVANQAFVHFFENRKGRTYDIPAAKGD